MNPQFVIDAQGHTTAVLLSIEDFQALLQGQETSVRHPEAQGPAAWEILVSHPGGVTSPETLQARIDAERNAWDLG